MTTYSVQIDLSTSTLQQLQAGGFSLLVLKSVSAPVGGAAPLVWYQTRGFMQQTSVPWQDQYMGFTSQSQIQSGAVIQPSFEAPMNLGQILTVSDPSGMGMVQNGGPSGALAVQSDISNPLTTGHAQVVGSGQRGLVAAFPLMPHTTISMKPINKVLLLFSSQPAQSGAVMTQALAPGFLVDVDGSSNDSREVTFDINSGWSCGGCSWAQPVQQGANLAPLLLG